MAYTGELNGLPPAVAAQFRAGANDTWPTADNVRLAEIQHNPTLRHVQTVSGGALQGLVQSPYLSRVYADSAHFGPSAPPAAQIEAVAQLRTLAQDRLLSRTSGEHIISLGALSILPPSARAHQAGYLQGLMRGRHEVSLVAPDVLEELGLADGCMVLLSGETNLSAPAAKITRLQIGLSEGQLVATEPENAGEFYPPWQVEGARLAEQFRELRSQTYNRQQTWDHLTSLAASPSL